VRAGHEHPAEGRGNCDLTIAVSPNLGPFRKSLFLACLFLATGMFVPAPDDARPWPSQGTPELCPVETPSPPPSRPITWRIRPRGCPAARLLAVMFDTEDVCCISQEALKAQGFGKALPGVLRALADAGFVSRQVGASRIPDTYRLAIGDAL
jgi:hypothetical protein